jgi:hypothetical protein
VTRQSTTYLHTKTHSGGYATLLITCHHIGGLVIDLQPLEWMASDEVHDPPIHEEGYVSIGEPMQYGPHGHHMMRKRSFLG